MRSMNIIADLEVQVIQLHKRNMPLLLQVHTMISPKHTTLIFAVKTLLFFLEKTINTQLILQPQLMIAMLLTVPDGA